MAKYQITLTKTFVIDDNQFPEECKLLEVVKPASHQAVLFNSLFDMDLDATKDFEIAVKPIK